MAELFHNLSLQYLREVAGELPFIRCPIHGEVLLDLHEYGRQMNRPDDLWQCPLCGSVSQWVGEE